MSAALTFPPKRKAIKNNRTKLLSYIGSSNADNMSAIESSLILFFIYTIMYDPGLPADFDYSLVEDKPDPYGDTGDMDDDSEI